MKALKQLFHNPVRIFMWFLFILYLILLVKFIIIKYMTIGDILYNTSNRINSVDQANLIPLKTITYNLQNSSNNFYIYFVENIIGNIVAFIPLGFFIKILSRGKIGIILVLIATLFTSLLFELFQLFTGVGSFDVDDLLLNVVGGLFGFVVYYIYGNRRANNNPGKSDSKDNGA